MGGSPDGDDSDGAGLPWFRVWTVANTRRDQPFGIQAAGEFERGLAGVPWFARLGEPSPWDGGCVRISAWEEWPGPENARGEAFGQALQDMAARDSVLDPYKPYLIQRWNAGARDARALHPEITARGYTGSDQQVRRFVRPFRELPGPVPAPPPAIPSARKITTWLMTNPGNLTADDAAALAAVTIACPHLRQLQGAIRSFCDMMTGLTGARHLDAWLAAADASNLDQLRSFARGIRKDHAAVLNALTLPYSSGKVEGTVNKIKMLKRQTYGRASFELLRKRVLLA